VGVNAYGYAKLAQEPDLNVTRNNWTSPIRIQVRMKRPNKSAVAGRAGPASVKRLSGGNGVPSWFRTAAELWRL
jgi:hypothetical protein